MVHRAFGRSGTRTVFVRYAQSFKAGCHQQPEHSQVATTAPPQPSSPFTTAPTWHQHQTPLSKAHPTVTSTHPPTHPHPQLIPPPDERLLAAAREDNEILLQEIFDEGNFDINFQDGCVLFFSIQFI